MPVSWWLEPVDALVPEGAQLVLERSQGFYQRGPAQNPIDWAFFGTPQHSSAGSTPVPVELGDGQSMLTLQPFDPGADAFFEPSGVDGWLVNRPPPLSRTMSVAFAASASASS